MDLKLRNAEKRDMEAVLLLIKELAAFEKQPNAVDISTDELIKDGFNDKPWFKIIVAEYNNQIIGMALFYNRYSTWKGRSLHLEDLIVKREFRGKGIGAKLYKEVLMYAHKNGLKRVAWEVLDWNKVAIDFYISTGAEVFKEWRIAQINQENISKYLNKI